MIQMDAVGHYEFNQMMKNNAQLLETSYSNMSKKWTSLRSGKKKDRPDENSILIELINIFIDRVDVQFQEKTKIIGFLRQEVCKMGRTDNDWREAPSSALCNFLIHAIRGTITETNQEIEERNSLIEKGKQQFEAFSSEVMEKAKKIGNEILKKRETFNEDTFTDHKWDLKTHDLVKVFFISNDICRQIKNFRQACQDIQLLALSTFVNELTTLDDQRKALQAYLFQINISEPARLTASRRPHLFQDPQLYFHYAEVTEKQLEAIQEKCTTFFSD